MKRSTALCTNLLYTMPDCLIKTIESLRKHKLEHWDRNRETNRAWLSLNMMTEARAGFRAFHYGSKDQREVDFVLLRQRLAQGASWSDELIEEIAPWTAQAGHAGKMMTNEQRPAGIRARGTGSPGHSGFAQGQHC